MVVTRQDDKKDFPVVHNQRQNTDDICLDGLLDLFDEFRASRLTSKYSVGLALLLLPLLLPSRAASRSSRSPCRLKDTPSASPVSESGLIICLPLALTFAIHSSRSLRVKFEFDLCRL
eukprot:746160-Hanusia_phi.AAC.2